MIDCCVKNDTGTTNQYTAVTNWPTYDDTCDGDCHSRCPHCGKRKRNWPTWYPYQVPFWTSPTTTWTYEPLTV